jgi:hypothetical protein
MNSFRKLNIIGLNTKNCIIFSIIPVLALMTVPSTISESFADRETNMTWQLVFISIEECGPDDKYDEIYSGLTSKYLELYQLENTAFDVTCMSESEYDDFQMNDQVQLLILIYDGLLGQKILEPNNLDGVYVHSGNNRLDNHLIILCHCSDYDTGYERTLTSWILSHELSHFVLSYKGFPQSDIQENIHDIEKEYDNCIGMNFQAVSCNDIKMTISPESSTKDFVVMKPYDPAIGNKLIKYIPDDYSDTEVIELQRNLAKMWLTNSIDDFAYSETLTHLVNGKNIENSESHEPFMEIPNGFVIAETSKPKDIEWNEYLQPENNSKDNLLKYIPFDFQEQPDEISIENMPNWFKNRALLWSEKRISDKVFFDGVEHLVRMNIIKLN